MVLSSSIHFSSDAGEIKIPQESISRCSSDSAEFKAMLRSFPPAEVNRWFLNKDGKCTSCLHPPKSERDAKSGYLLIDANSPEVLKLGIKNVGTAAWDQVLGIAHLVESGVKLTGRACEATKEYVVTQGKRNLLAEDAKHKKAELKQSAFSVLSDEDLVGEVDNYCQDAEKKIPKLSRDEAEFVFMQLENCQSMGHEVKAQAITQINQYFWKNRLPGSNTSLAISSKNKIPLSEANLIKRYRDFQSFEPTLNSAQAFSAAHSLDQILVSAIASKMKDSAIDHIKGFSCLPSSYRTLIEGKIGGNLVNPFEALAVLKWMKSSKIGRFAEAEEKIAQNVAVSTQSVTLENAATTELLPTRGFARSEATRPLPARNKTTLPLPRSSDKTTAVLGAESGPASTSTKRLTDASNTQRMPAGVEKGKAKGLALEKPILPSESSPFATYAAQKNLNRENAKMPRAKFRDEVNQRKVVKIDRFNANGNITQTYLVKLEGDMVGVFKPTAMENKSIATVTGAENEVVASVADELFGFKMVPKTAFKEIEIDGKKYRGSFQLFVPDSDIVRNIRDGYLSPNERVKMDLFDALINNTDRHSGNMIRDANDKLLAIDNGASFIKGEDRVNWVTGYKPRKSGYTLVERADGKVVKTQGTMAFGKPETKAFLQSPDGKELLKKMKSLDLPQIRSELEKAAPELNPRELASYSTRLDRQRKLILEFLETEGKARAPASSTGRETATVALPPRTPAETKRLEEATTRVLDPDHTKVLTPATRHPSSDATRLLE